MPTVEVNHEILRWARETAGLALEDAALKLGIGQSRGLTPQQRLEALELGTEMPTRTLLLKMSKQYRRPLLTFYLRQPPARGDRGVDFRRVLDPSPIQEGLVDALIRDIKARQSIVRSAIEDEDEAQPIPFVDSISINNGIAAASSAIQAHLNFNLQTFREQKSAAEAFSYLRNLAESAGYFVLLIGDLGSHHSTLSIDYFRGFALADAVAPFIVINDQDAKGAWSFTLLHELTHIGLGQTGISATLGEAGVEKFCNDVAATTLLNDHDLSELHLDALASFEETVSQIDTFAARINVSRSMVAYQLFQRGIIDQSRWHELQREFRRLWIDNKNRERDAARLRSGGPNYYIVRRYHIGNALVSLVSRMTKSGTLTSTKAGKILGVKPSNVFELISASR